MPQTKGIEAHNAGGKLCYDVVEGPRSIALYFGTVVNLAILIS